MRTIQNDYWQNTKKYYKISSLNTYHSIGCNCEDNISFSEKFIFKILKDINLDFTWHYSKSDCNWLKNNNKTYDFYFKLNDEEYIIESHGLQHYEYQGRGRTLEEEQTNDQYKYNLAIQNGIKSENYIVIDFRYSTLEWGKEHVLNSRLNEIFDLSNICKDIGLEIEIFNDMSDLSTRVNAKLTNIPAITGINSSLFSGEKGKTLEVYYDNEFTYFNRIEHFKKQDKSYTCKVGTDEIMENNNIIRYLLGFGLGLSDSIMKQLHFLFYYSYIEWYHLLFLSLLA